MGSISLMSTAARPARDISLALSLSGYTGEACGAFVGVFVCSFDSRPCAAFPHPQQWTQGRDEWETARCFLRKGYGHAMTDVNQLCSLTLPRWNVLGGVETIFRNFSFFFLFLFFYVEPQTDSHSFFLRGCFKGWNTLPFLFGLCINWFTQSPPLSSPARPRLMKTT